jgi:ankyrin repeat protein
MYYHQCAKIFHATRLGHDICLKRLLSDKRAEVNNKHIGGWTPLHDASKDGHNKCVKLLLDNGANINAKRAGGHSPLHDASINGHQDCILTLLDHGANIDETNNEGQTALDVADDNTKQFIQSYFLEIKEPETD